MHKVLAIVGPTAVGKTQLSIELAKQLNGEIISGDSMQVYRGLDIGTAKIKPEEMQGIPHHLIDICDVNERYTVARFVEDAIEAIKEIEAAGKLPIIVGGTGFYLQALEQGLNLGGNQDVSESPVRQELLAKATEMGYQAMHDWLLKVDPKAAEKIPATNQRRVIRALEVYLQTGERFSEQINNESNLDFKYVTLTADRELLYDRINRRVDIMVEEGLFKEARWLYDQGGRSLSASQGIGYHELFDYFDNQTSKENAIAKVKQDSRHYAKRQLTWFRHKVKSNWYNLIQHENTVDEIIEDAREWLKN
ncbi:tRNA (adenosine(37)-N6)-dimethylallyltransferase MiaA [Lentilactobacillus sp. SPB1-3]|uniref:tRNA (Adenosine(37)-N6)-dimethylallyltransferase MiaA n=1 Tax=Lentilactobacillus terminaliae TaxID=3003483 RepID=A0ACD5DBY7_9LACO|nr:tRNA (adenosine(37)-N6)-dimethylallyltransferase MiaA [Lentilactobacillus sp. SPB1-3]MCZ0977121.1 tRNA (adenosine(37)-N6)-dimethylallyltransferase MiaA [Lentilactobacillus sp. SPB1-3]